MLSISEIFSKLVCSKFRWSGRIAMTPVTIIIPTMNRYGYVERALSYYKKSGFDGFIVVGDSSEEKSAELVISIVENFMDCRFSIRYFHYHPSVPLIDVWRKLINEVDTKYITYAGDDDLQIPSGLNAAVSFLEENPAYIAAKCEMIEVEIGENKPFGEIVKVSRKIFPDYDNDSAVQRFATYAQMAISVQYGVYRTEAWRFAYEFAPEPYLPYFGEEFIPCSVCVVLGKLKSLPNLGTIQQVDGSGGVWKKRTMFDLLRAPEWPTLSRLFQAKLAELLTRIDRIVPTDAERVTEQILWWHVNMFMNHHYKIKHEKQREQEMKNSPSLFAELDHSQEFALVRDVFCRRYDILFQD